VGLTEDLGAGPVAVDTSAFIYFIEEHPRYLSIVEPVFQAMAAGDLEGVTSALTLLEVLVVPFRANDTALASRYETILTRSRGLRLIDLSLPQLRAAAQLRAATGMKTPDALQVAAALSAGCTALLTNDDRWPARVGGLRILRIEAYAG
jgi:predicted nucleic acid-binding protein